MKWSARSTKVGRQVATEDAFLHSFHLLIGPVAKLFTTKKTCRQCCKRAFCCFSFSLRHQAEVCSVGRHTFSFCVRHSSPAFCEHTKPSQNHFLSQVLSIVHIRCFAALKINSGAAVNSECKVDRSDSGTCNHTTALSPTFHLVADLAARRVLPKQPEPCPMR